METLYSTLNPFLADSYSIEIAPLPCLTVQMMHLISTYLSALVFTPVSSLFCSSFTLSPFPVGRYGFSSYFFRFINAKSCSGPLCGVLLLTLSTHSTDTDKTSVPDCQICKRHGTFFRNCLGIISLRFYQCCQLYAKNIPERNNFPRTTR